MLLSSIPILTVIYIYKLVGANLQSYRHMLIAFLNLGCTILLGFAILGMCICIA